MDQTTQPACRTAVDEVRQRFEAWRKNRKLGSPIPDNLWDKAVQLARAHGVNPIARALHLDYYDLKRRASCPRVGVSSHPAFIEVAVSPPPVSVESLVEMERPDGARMRIRVAGQLDLLALTEAFWRCRA